MILKTLAGVVVGSAMAFANSEHPCQKVVDACAKKGFVRGEAKKGMGLWKDCVDPLMQHAPQPAGAKIPLPVVDTRIISACKQAHGTFGEVEHMKAPPPPPAPPTQ